MPKFEVEVSFFVVADDIDDAFDKTKAWLDRQEIELSDGIRTYHTFDDCITELKDEDGA